MQNKTKNKIHLNIVYKHTIIGYRFTTINISDF